MTQDQSGDPRPSSTPTTPTPPVSTLSEVGSPPVLLILGFAAVLLGMVGAITAGVVWLALGAGSGGESRAPNLSAEPTQAEARSPSMSPTAAPTAVRAGSVSSASSDSRIAFVTTDPAAGPERVYVADMEGAVQELPAGAGRISTPSWSPDRIRIVFAAYTTPTAGAPGGAPRLWVMNADGSNAVMLSGTQNDFQPSWSVSGESIVFVSGQNSGPMGALQLFIMSVNGSQREQLKPDQSMVHGHPAWSPRGNQIAYHARPVGTTNNDVYVINVTGNVVTRLTDDAASDETPSWSPDSSRIVFASLRSGASDIYVVNADGSGLVRLTDDAARDTFPVYSPDGSRIAFVSTRGGGSQIFVMDADGANVRQLTSSPGAKSYLSW